MSYKNSSIIRKKNHLKFDQNEKMFEEEEDNLSFSQFQDLLSEINSPFHQIKEEKLRKLRKIIQSRKFELLDTEIPEFLIFLMSSSNQSQFSLLLITIKDLIFYYPETIERFISSDFLNWCFSRVTSPPKAFVASILNVMVIIADHIPDLLPSIYSFLTPQLCYDIVVSIPDSSVERKEQIGNQTLFFLLKVCIHNQNDIDYCKILETIQYTMNVQECQLYLSFHCLNVLLSNNRISLEDLNYIEVVSCLKYGFSDYRDVTRTCELMISMFENNWNGDMFPIEEAFMAIDSFKSDSCCIPLLNSIYLAIKRLSEQIVPVILKMSYQRTLAKMIVVHDKQVQDDIENVYSMKEAAGKTLVALIKRCNDDLRCFGSCCVFRALLVLLKFECSKFRINSMKSFVKIYTFMQASEKQDDFIHKFSKCDGPDIAMSFEPENNEENTVFQVFWDVVKHIDG